MIEIIAAKILALYLSVFGVQDVSKVDLPDGLKLQHSWQQSGAYHSLAIDASGLIAGCKKHPKYFVAFPVVLHAIQEVWVDGHFFSATGSLQENTTDGVYSAPELSCFQIADATSFVWKVHAPSPFFTNVSTWPKIDSHRPLSAIVNNAVHGVGAAVLLFIWIFNLAIFGSHLDRGFMVLFTGTCMTLALYSIFCVLGPLGITIDVLTAHRQVDLSSNIGCALLFILLYYQGYVSKLLCRAGVVGTLFSLFMIVGGAGHDEIQAASHLAFLFYLPIIANILLYALIRILKQWHAGRSGAEVYPVLLFLVAGVNDICVVVGVFDGFMLFPAGLIFLLFNQAFYLNREFSFIFSERNTLKRQLDAAYREKEKVVKRNAVANTVAHTVQILAREIKQPFRMLRSVLDRIERENPSEEKVRAYTGEVNDALGRAEGLLRTFLSAK